MFRFFSRIWSCATRLTRPQVRSVFAVAMLLGIVALSVQGWAYVALMHHEAHNPPLVELMFMVLRDALGWTFILIGVLTAFVALIVFGADYLTFKYGDTEIRAGRGQAPDAEDDPYRRASYEPRYEPRYDRTRYDPRTDPRYDEGGIYDTYVEGGEDYSFSYEDRDFRVNASRRGSRDLG